MRRLKLHIIRIYLASKLSIISYFDRLIIMTHADELQRLRDINEELFAVSLTDEQEKSQ